MNVFFDTNVIIDSLTVRANSGVSRKLMLYVVENKITGFICTKQITDLHYILKKYLSDEERKKVIKIISNMFTLLPLLPSDIKYCLNTKMGDFEDAVLDEVASTNTISYFVTNNVKDYIGAKTMIFSPDELLKLAEHMDNNVIPTILK